MLAAGPGELVSRREHARALGRRQRVDGITRRRHPGGEERGDVRRAAGGRVGLPSTREAHAARSLPRGQIGNRLRLDDGVDPGPLHRRHHSDDDTLTLRRPRLHRGRQCVRRGARGRGLDPRRFDEALARRHGSPVGLHGAHDRPVGGDGGHGLPPECGAAVALQEHATRIGRCRACSRIGRAWRHERLGPAGGAPGPPHSAEHEQTAGAPQERSPRRRVTPWKDSRWHGRRRLSQPQHVRARHIFRGKNCEKCRSHCPVSADRSLDEHLELLSYEQGRPPRGIALVDHLQDARVDPLRVVAGE